MAPVADQGVVEELQAAGQYPPRHDSVYPWYPDTGAHHLDTRIASNSPPELPFPFSHQQPRPAFGVLKVYDQVPCRRRPRCGRPRLTST